MLIFSSVIGIFLMGECVFLFFMHLPHEVFISFLYRNFKQLSGEMEFMTINGTRLRNLEILQNQSANIRAI